MRWKKEPKQECMHSFRLEAEATVVDTTGTRRPCDYAKVQTHKCVYCSKRENRFIDPLG